MTEARPGSQTGAGWALAVLFLVNVFNQGDRMLFGVVVDPIRRDLVLSDTQISLIGGLFFVLFNLVAGLFLARLIDRGNRVRILAMGLVGWSLATAAQGLAQDFWSLAAARIAVGVGEATAFPAAMSLIADLFQPARRGRAVGIFQSSSFVGIVGGTVIAGVLGALLGWRMMFIACGLAGVGVALLLLLTVREPAREGGQAAAVASSGVVRDVIGGCLRVGKRRGLLLLGAGLSLAAMMTFVLASWGPSFLLRSHGVPLAQVGLVIGPSVGLGGIIGTLASGFLADWQVRRNGGDPAAGLLVPLLCAPLALPFMAGFLFMPSLALAMVCAGIMNMVLSAALPPAFTYAISTAPPGDRALTSTVLLAVMGLLGASLGPFVVGTLSDWMAPVYGEESLRRAMAALLVTPLLGTALLALAWRRSRRGAAPESVPDPVINPEENT